MGRNGTVLILEEIGTMVAFRAKGGTHWDGKNDESDTAH